eukprot:s4647_g5.t2
MLRIESLTPEADIAEAERKQDRVMMYHHCTGLVKPVPVTELVKNRTPYSQRGWCAAERDWSSTRAATNLSREVDAPEGEKGGLAPMARRFGCRRTRHRPVGFGELPDPGVAEEIKLRRLYLQHDELLEEGTRQVTEALQTNSALIELSLSQCLDSDGVSALAEALKQNRTLKQLSLGRTEIAEEGTFALLEAHRASGVQPDLTNSDLGKVKGAVTHPVVEFLVELQAIPSTSSRCAGPCRGSRSSESCGFISAASAAPSARGQPGPRHRLARRRGREGPGHRPRAAPKAAEALFEPHHQRDRLAGAEAVVQSLHKLQRLTDTVVLSENKLGKEEQKLRAALNALPIDEKPITI